MGSIGQSETACTTLNFAKSREMELACLTDNAQLTEVKLVGVAKDDASSCTKLDQAPLASKGSQFFGKCYVDNLDADYSKFARNTDQLLFDADQEKKFLDYYAANCQGKHSCKLPIDPKAGWPLSGVCSDELLAREYHSEYLTAPAKLKTKAGSTG